MTFVSKVFLLKAKAIENVTLKTNAYVACWACTRLANQKAVLYILLVHVKQPFFASFARALEENLAAFEFLVSLQSDHALHEIFVNDFHFVRTAE